MKRLIRNSAQCLKCGDAIESTHVHDFKWCSCKNIAVDGGLEYIKRVGDIENKFSKDTSLSEMVLSCYIMSGVPGSGKSSWAQDKLYTFGDEKIIFSADNYFMRTGKYLFNEMEAGKAHDDCLRQFAEAVSDGARMVHLGQEDPDPPILVVDNTNTTSEEIAPYYRLAHAYGYKVTLVTFDIDPEIAAKRNAHGVALKHVISMASRLKQRKLPPYWDLKHKRFTWKSEYNDYMES